MKINEFIEYFCKGKKIEYTRIKNEFFLVKNENKQILNKIKKNGGKEPISMGLPLGTEKGYFQPSLAFLELLSEWSKKKVFVNDKGEWLFVCGRDLMRGSVEKNFVNNGLVLVQNKRDENLGLGKIIMNLSDKSMRPNKVVIKNVANRGDYLGK